MLRCWMGLPSRRQELRHWANEYRLEANRIAAAERRARKSRKAPKALSSELIRRAVYRTYVEWLARYGVLPDERLRTEIDTRAVKSRNPGYCYKVAGWIPDRVVRGKLYLFAPERGAWELTG